MSGSSSGDSASEVAARSSTASQARSPPPAAVLASPTRLPLTSADGSRSSDGQLQSARGVSSAKAASMVHTDGYSLRSPCLRCKKLNLVNRAKHAIIRFFCTTFTHHTANSC